MSNISKEQLKKHIFEVAEEREGKFYMPCANAFSLAKKYNIKISEIGDACNEHKIKICKCQLGCFN